MRGSGSLHYLRGCLVGGVVFGGGGVRLGQILDLNPKPYTCRPLLNSRFNPTSCHSFDAAGGGASLPPLSPEAPRPHDSAFAGSSVVCFGRGFISSDF